MQPADPGTTRREILRRELDAWHAEGVLDEATYRLLRSRYDHAPPGELDAPLVSPGGGGAGAASGRPEPVRPGEAEDRRSRAADVTQFVGGLLVGAAMVALVVFLGYDGAAAELPLAMLGGVLLAGAVAAQLRVGETHASLVEAAYAAGLVPLGVAAAMGFDNDAALGPLVLALVVGAHAFKRGRGASIALCAIVFAIGSAAVSMQLFDDTRGTQPGLWLVLLSGYLALTLVWRRDRWSDVSAGLLVLPMTLAYLFLLDQAFETDSTLLLEVAVALFLGALFGIGLWLSSRGLVAAAAAGLTIDAIVFAFDLGGAGTALVVLLALGGFLVWQGQAIRAYFAKRH